MSSNLYDMLKSICEFSGESIDELVTIPTLEELRVEFENGFGSYNTGIDLKLFAWGKDWVYYLDDYDGLKSIKRVPRNPISESYLDEDWN